MVVHMFAFRWKVEATEAQKGEAVVAIKTLQGVIPGLLATFVGVNVSPRSRGYALGGAMHFAGLAELEAYGTHPAHVALLGWLVPLIEAVEVDFEA